MEFETFGYVYLMATGFTIAGLTMAAVGLATGKPMGFALGNLNGSPLAVLSILLRLVAGPAILVRNAFQAGMTMQTDPVWLVIGIVFAGAWALTSGALILQAIGAS